jgi:hypothetical protein
LRAHWQEAKLAQNFQILDSDDQQRLVKRVIRELGLDEQRWPARQAQWWINAQKDEGLRPRNIQAGGDLFLATQLKIYEAYEEACARSRRWARPWKVPTHMPCGLTCSNCSMRWRISAAALLVKVTDRIECSEARST